MSKFCFLIGAHKTGTTYLSKKLLENQSLLNEHGVRFETTGTVNPALTRRLIEADQDPKALVKMREFLITKSENYSRALFIHENISGIIGSFYSYGAIYPRIMPRLKLLNMVMQEAEIEIVFNIRSYDTFILSSYSEYIRGYGYVGFEDFEAKLVSQDLSWVTVIDSIAIAYPNAKITCCDHALLIEDEKKITDYLIGNSTIDLSEATIQLARPSISQAGLEVLKVLNRFGVLEDQPKLIEAIARTLPKSPAYGKLSPWTDSEMPARLHERFIADKAELSSRYHFLV